MDIQTMPNTQVKIRLDSELKEEAETILGQLGLSTQDFTRMALHQLVMRRGLPFSVNIPNAETEAALSEYEAERAAGTLHEHDNVADMFADLESTGDQSSAK